jgi:hypothetical protein
LNVVAEHDPIIAMAFNRIDRSKTSPLGSTLPSGGSNFRH